MNWVDLIIIATLIFFTLKSWDQPVVLEFLDLFSFVFSSFLSFSNYNLLAKLYETNFQIPRSLSLIVGFMSVWFLSESIFFICVRILFPKFPVLRFKGSRILPLVPAFLKGLIFIAFTLVMIATFPIQPAVKKAVLDSKMGSVILKNAYALEQPVKNVFGGVTNDNLTFLTIKPKTDQKINLGFKTADFETDESAENKMVDLVNKERADKNLKMLVLDRGLRAIARGYSADMLKKGYFSHYSLEGFSVADRMTQAGIDYLVVGENLAYAPSVESAHKGLMNSEGHRVNILSKDYAKIGIGAMDGGVYSKMFTQVFSN